VRSGGGGGDRPPLGSNPPPSWQVPRRGRGGGNVEAFEFTKFNFVKMLVFFFEVIVILQAEMVPAVILLAQKLCKVYFFCGEMLFYLLAGH